MSSYQNIYACHEQGSKLRPRELFQLRGPASLSDRKLLALVLGSGTRQMPVEELATQVMERLDRHGREISAKHLDGIPGLGPVRRLQILAAMELFRRINLPHHPRIRNPKDLLEVLARWSDREQECFITISLNGANELIRSTVVSVGIVNRALVHPREIFAEAIRDRATSLVLAHNHPSGNVQPSPEDIAVTKRLCKAGNLMGIPILDHLIFSKGEFFSFLDHCLISAQESWQT